MWGWHLLAFTINLASAIVKHIRTKTFPSKIGHNWSLNRPLGLAKPDVRLPPDHRIDAEQQQQRPDQINVADVLKSCNSSIRAVNKFLSGTKTIKTFVGSNGLYAVLVPYIGATFWWLIWATSFVHEINTIISIVKICNCIRSSRYNFASKSFSQSYKRTKIVI